MDGDHGVLPCANPAFFSPEVFPLSTTGYLPCVVEYTSVCHMGQGSDFSSRSSVLKQNQSCRDALIARSVHGRPSTALRALSNTG